MASYPQRPLDSDRTGEGVEGGRGRGIRRYHSPEDYDPRRERLGGPPRGDEYSNAHNRADEHGPAASSTGYYHDSSDLRRRESRSRAGSSGRDRHGGDGDCRDRSRSRSPPSSRTSRRRDRYDDGHFADAPQSFSSMEEAFDRRRASSARDDLEAERRARMARLRAENEEEEQVLHRQQRSVGDSASSTGAEARRSGMAVDASELDGLDEDEQMRLLLGFDGFASTKNTKVDDNHRTSARGAAAKNKARKYRQYMNRKNGFNRPLDKMD